MTGKRALYRRKPCTETPCSVLYLVGIYRYADCVEGAVEKGIIYGTGVYHAGEIKDTKCMQEAYMMGKNV